MENRETKYWIITASKDHVKDGVSQGIVQASHGKTAPLKRMQKGDLVLYYSGKQTLGKPDKCQEFTAIGKIQDDEIFQAKISEDFVPFRRKAEFFKGEDVSILPLIKHLHFIKNKDKWGAPFRFGMLEIPKEDFDLISAKMLQNDKN